MNEFNEIIRHLQEGRPELTQPELDEIKQRVRRRVARPSGRTQSMRSRLAILAMLVAGILFSTAGAGLALDGALNGSNASEAQYGAQASPSPEAGAVAGEQQSASNSPTTPSSATAPAQAVQPARQEAASTGNSLPFTGFAAIPVLVGGLALLGGGLVLRRRSSTQ